MDWVTRLRGPFLLVIAKGAAVQVWVWLGFALYCVALGSRWIVDQAVPPPLTGLASVGAHHVLLFGVWVGWCLVRRPGGIKLLRKTWWQVALLAATVFVVPNAIIEGAGGTVDGLSEALVFTLAPVGVVFAVAQQSFEFGMQSDPRRLLGPALAGVFGAALLIPFTMPPSVAGKLWLAALVASAVGAGLAAVRLHGLLQGVPVAAAAALTSGVIAGVGLGFSHRHGAALVALGADHRALLLETLQTLWLDAPLLLLSLWMTRDLPPLAVVTRYPLVLLVTIVESYFLMHGTGSLVMLAGGLLVAVSVVWLLRTAVAMKDDSVSSPGR